jgi:hypothetical protein
MNSPTQKILPPSGIRKKTFRIANWKTWDDKVDLAVAVFREKFACFPEIFVASSATHFRIDTVARTLKLEKFQDPVTGLSPETPPDSGIGEFCGADYTLEFCIDEGIPDGLFVLVYDPDPDEGEPMPMDDEDEGESERPNEKAG